MDLTVVDEVAAVVVVAVALEIEVDVEAVAEELLEAAVAVLQIVGALVTSKARSRLFKSSTLPHTNFSEVKC